MRPVIITQVRHDEAAGRAALQHYVHGGHFGPRRVPRGVEPALVERFLLETLPPEASPDAFAKALQAMRFYEAAGVAPRMSAVLKGGEVDLHDIERAAHALQAVADFAAPTHATAAVAYLERHLLPMPEVLQLLPLLLETLVALAPAGGFDAIEAKVAGALATAAAAAAVQPRDEVALMHHDKLRAWLHVDIPPARALADAKVQCLALPAPQRRREMVRGYLGQADHGGPWLENHFGRLLRHDAMHGAQAEVLAALHEALDDACRRPAGDDRDAVLRRAGQAIVYLGGELTSVQQPLYGAAADMDVAHFLWDDPA